MHCSSRLLCFAMTAYTLNSAIVISYWLCAVCIHYFILTPKVGARKCHPLLKDWLLTNRLSQSPSTWFIEVGILSNMVPPILVWLANQGFKTSPKVLKHSMIGCRGCYITGFVNDNYWGSRRELTEFTIILLRSNMWLTWQNQNIFIYFVELASDMQGVY